MHIKPEELIEYEKDEELKQFEYSVSGLKTMTEKLRVCWVMFNNCSYLQDLNYD